MTKSSTIKSIVPIFSGGIDSSTMLWYLTSNDYEIKEVLTFQYGQSHQKEVEYSKNVVSEYSKKFYPIIQQIVDIENIGSLISKGSITGDQSTPHNMYDAKTQRVTIVPNRNMIFLSIAGGRAVTVGAKFVGYAAHASDYSVYPDCRPEFIEALDKAMYLGNLWDPVNIIAPFQNKSKTEIVKLGHELNVPYELTWSCYEGFNRPCLRCGTCIERSEAFYANNLTDPALSKTEWIAAIQILEKYSKSKN